MAQPNFEDLKERIATYEKESSEASWLKEVEKTMLRVNDAIHPDTEALCGYADGVLRRNHPAIWRQVDKHLKEERCLECQYEVKQLRSAISFPRRIWDGFETVVNGLKEAWRNSRVLGKMAEAVASIVVFIVERAIQPLLHNVPKVAAFLAAILIAFVSGSAIVGYQVGVAKPKAEVQIYKEEVKELRELIETLRAKLVEEEAKKEAFKEANRKLLELLERLRASVPKERIASPPSSVPVSYTDPRVLPVFPEVPYTDPRVQPAFPEVPYTPPPKPRK